MSSVEPSIIEEVPVGLEGGELHLPILPELLILQNFELDSI